MSNRFPGDHSKKSNNFIKSLISELKFCLVICDGPPGGTKGGRSGLIPVMRSKLERSALILLDDAARPYERLIAELWLNKFHAKVEVSGIRKLFFKIRL
ncbi:MAG: hypothetical protein Q7J06_09235 [Bacteroidales bacterium]|nr:hypothetical protein [Bacteroidales bacterium]